MSKDQSTRRHEFTRAPWGFLVFTAASAFALIRLVLIQGEAAHYTLFIRAARALLAENSPYGSDFGTHIGYFFYSPACALQIFAPLSFLPDRAGLFLFSVFSWGALVFGARALLRSFNLQARDLRTETFWLLLLPAILGGIAAVKLEVATTGAVLYAASLVLGRRPILAGFLLGVVGSWKLQTLPAIGLLAILEITRFRIVTLPLAALLGFAVSLATSLLVVSPASWLPLHQEGLSGLSAHLEGGLLHFENVFAAVFGWTGLAIPMHIANWITCLMGALFAGAVGFSSISSGEDPKIPMLLTLALLGFFSVMFPPLHQNNAMILFAPLAFAAVALLPFTPELRGMGLVFLAFLLHSLAYSDLLPDSFRDAVYARKPKLFAHLLLLAVFGLEWMRVGKSTRRVDTSFPSR